MTTGTSHKLVTDDLAFSAFLKMKGYLLIKRQRKLSKSTFIFNVGSENSETLKMQFVNSDFLNFYNELRNLKKLL